MYKQKNYNQRFHGDTKKNNETERNKKSKNGGRKVNNKQEC